MSCWEEEHCYVDPERILYLQYIEEQKREMYAEKLKALENNKLIIHISEREYPHSPVWIGANGQKYHIEQMTTKHIKNCLKMIYKNNGNWRQEFIRPFECELRRRKYVQSLSEC